MNREILKLNSNELHFVRHNISLKENKIFFLFSQIENQRFSTSLNNNIKSNFPFALQSRVNPHFHSHSTTKPPIKIGSSAIVSKSLNGSRLGARDKTCYDIHNEVLPLTLQPEIKQHRIISLIKRNC